MSGQRHPATTWRSLQAWPRDEMIAARLQLHAAAQLPAAAAAALLPAAADDSHTALTWEPGTARLWTGAGPDGRRVGLGMRELALHVEPGGAGSGAMQVLPLDGRTLDEARWWLGRSLGLAAPPALPSHDLPASPALAGGAFSAPGSGEAALADWFHDAALALAALQQRRPAMGPVRCWPHHFDVAVLEPVDAAGSGPARSVGAGLAPGDAVFPLPYFYVRPWPSPGPRGLAPLPEGAWYTGSWVGAVLAAHDLLGADPGEQEGRVRLFLEAATAAARGLLTGPVP